MDLPENYSFRYRHRVHYQNCCNYCFSTQNLLKCSSCKCVYYCSKSHQKNDWSFHRPTCIAFKEISALVPCPEICDAEAVFQYRNCITELLMKKRNFVHPSQLTEYERQLCLIPWVCPVCFKKPSKIFECDSCESVIYCSEEHLADDYFRHIMMCWNWKLSRVFSSLPYENGYKVKEKPYTYQPIRRTIKRWPYDKFELIEIAQSDTIIGKGTDTFIAAAIFINPYIPGAIIINVLDKIGIIKKRSLMRRLFDERRHNSRKPSKSICYGYQILKKKSTMTIHFAIADCYEITFDWSKIAQLLTDWIINVSQIEVVLACPRLENDYIIPSFDNLDQTIKVYIHQKAYYELENLSVPDVIVMLECERAFALHQHLPAIYTKMKNALFKYRDIPVILCDGQFEALTNICHEFMKCGDLKSLATMEINTFTHHTTSRIWNKAGMNIYSRDSKFSVLKKC